MEKCARDSISVCVCVCAQTQGDKLRSMPGIPLECVCVRVCVPMCLFVPTNVNTRKQMEECWPTISLECVLACACVCMHVYLYPWMCTNQCKDAETNRWRENNWTLKSLSCAIPRHFDHVFRPAIHSYTLSKRRPHPYPAHVCVLGVANECGQP